MGRAKLNMELIKNEKSRISTYHKRKDGLKKKTKELAILCGVKACIIIAGPPLAGHQPVVETFPENPSEVKALIKSYKQQSAEDHRKRTLTLSNFLEVKKKKVENSLMKLKKENCELKYPTWDEEYNGMIEEQLRGFEKFLEGKIEAVRARIDLLKGKQIMNVFSCQNYGVENENIENYGGVQFSSRQDLSPCLMQNMFAPGLNSIDFFDQTQQGLHIDPNSMTMMLMNNSGHLNGGASSSNMFFAPYNGPPVYCDPMSMEVKSMVTNNPMMASPLCIYGPALQPMQPYMQYPMNIGTSSQKHGSQYDEYGQADDFEMKKLQ